MTSPQTRQAGESLSPAAAVPVTDAVRLGSSLLPRPSVPRQKFSLYGAYRIFRRNRRGASAVEFALVAPVFFIFVFGIIEYGRLVMVQQVLTNATREGARRAVLDGATESAVESAVRNYLTNASIAGESELVKVDVEPPLYDLDSSDEAITVSITLPFTHVSWLPSPWFLNGQQLHARSVMRREAMN